MGILSTSWLIVWPQVINKILFVWGQLIKYYLFGANEFMCKVIKVKNREQSLQPLCMLSFYFILLVWFFFLSLFLFLKNENLHLTNLFSCNALIFFIFRVWKLETSSITPKQAPKLNKNQGKWRDIKWRKRRYIEGR
jgi:hypothetical protein